MNTTQHITEDGRIEVREARADDTSQRMRNIEEISAESDFLTFSPGEFDLTEEQERAFLKACAESANQLYLVAVLKGELVGTLSFTASDRRRVRHDNARAIALYLKKGFIFEGRIRSDFCVDGKYFDHCCMGWSKPPPGAPGP